jgi:hypothetical protein
VLDPERDAVRLGKRTGSKLIARPPDGGDAVSGVLSRSVVAAGSRLVMS